MKNQTQETFTYHQLFLLKITWVEEVYTKILVYRALEFASKTAKQDQQCYESILHDLKHELLVDLTDIPAR